VEDNILEKNVGKIICMLRYHSLQQYLQKQFPFPVFKICVDAGFTCPNRDGTKAIGGCTYCNERGSGAPTINRSYSWKEQFETAARKIRINHPDARLIIYFQAFSNTYASLDYLKTIYTAALQKEGVVGLFIGTRPDCISIEKLDFIAELAQNAYICLEYGAETIHNKTLQQLNRRHTFEDFIEAYRLAKERNIQICIHTITGLPGETSDDILQTAQTIAALKPDGIKLHSLYIETETELYRRFLKHPWRLFTEDEYIELTARILEYLPPFTVIHRLVGEAIPERLFAPEWSKYKQRILFKINKKLEKWNSYQGAKFQA